MVTVNFLLLLPRLHQIFFVSLTSSQPVCRVPLEERPQQRLRLSAQVLWRPQLGLEDLRHGLLAVLALERQLPRQHLILEREKAMNGLSATRVIHKEQVAATHED